MVNKNMKKSEIIEYILELDPEINKEGLKMLKKSRLLQIVKELEDSKMLKAYPFSGEEEPLEEFEEEVVPEEPEPAVSPPVEERCVVAIYRGERPYVVVGGVTFLKDREVKLTLDKIKVLDAIYKNPEFEIKL